MSPQQRQPGTIEASPPTSKGGGVERKLNASYKETTPTTEDKIQSVVILPLTTTSLLSSTQGHLLYRCIGMSETFLKELLHVLEVCPYLASLLFTGCHKGEKESYTCKRYTLR